MICLPGAAQTPPVTAPPEGAGAPPVAAPSADAPSEPAPKSPAPNAGGSAQPSGEGAAGDAPAGGDEPARPPEEPGKGDAAKDAQSKPDERGGLGGANDDGGGDAGTFRVRARVFAGFEYEREASANAQGESDREYGFVVRQARLGVKGELAEDFELNVTVDVADVLDPETGTAFDAPALIRTAVLQYQPSRALQLSVGRYKRPFSRLELESSADLPILRRGLWNELAIEENQWGDRAIGAMVSGRVKKPKLRWYLSMTNPAWSSAVQYQGYDVTGRVQLTLSKPFTLGVHAAYKHVDIGGRDRQGVAFGGDLDFELGGTHVLLDASYAELVLRNGEPSGMGVVLLAEQRIPLLAEWALAPTVALEAADADSGLSQTESLRLTFGVNLLGHAVFRVMPQVALVRSLGDTSDANPWPDSEQYSLILTVAP